MDGEGFPVIRSIASFGLEDYTVYVSTGKSTEKVKQIADNNKVALLFQQEGQELSNYVNVAVRGVAKQVKDEIEQQKSVEIIDSHSPGYKDRVKAAGIENLAIFRIEPVEIKILDLSKRTSGNTLEIITEF